MGFFSKLFRRADKRPMVVEQGMVVFRTRELAESLPPPEKPYFGDEQQRPCNKCGAAVDEVFITSGGPMGDPDVWRDVPVAVDGWACAGCGVFRYPRKITPDAINALATEGVSHGRAGRFAEAELCFARMTWNWPGYTAGHVNYAEAIRDRLQSAPPDDDQVRRRLVRRMVDQYERAVAAFQAEPTPPAAVGSIARACGILAELAIGERALDRARRYLDYVATLDGVPDDQAKTARELDEYVRTRRDLSDAASKVLSPRIKLDDRPARPPVTPAERAEIAKAIEDLEEHMRLAPDRWEAAWLHAKSLPLLGKRDEAFAAWQRAFERFPAARDLARDYAGELLHAGLATQGRDVARAIVDRLPDDATLWCNLAVAELLAGDLDAAEAALAHSRARDLDAADPITKVMIKRCAAYRDGAPLPKTLAELSRGP